MPRVVRTYDVPNGTIIATPSLISFHLHARVHPPPLWQRQSLTRLRHPAIRAVKCLQGRHPTVTHSSYLSLALSVSLSVFRPLFSPLSLSLSPSHSFSLPFSFYPLPLPSPPPPSSRGLVLYTHQTPRPTPTTIARSFRRIAKTHPLVSISSDVCRVRPHENSTLSRYTSTPRLPSPSDLGLRFPPACLRVSSRAGISLAHGTLYLSPTFRCVSNALVPGVSGITTDRCYDD